MYRRENKKTLSTSLNKYVAIQALVKVSDLEGGFLDTWTTIVGYEAVPASIWPMTVKLRFEFKSFNVIATDIIRFRHEIVIDTDLNRIVFDSRIFEIHGQENIQEGDEYLQLIVRERR